MNVWILLLVSIAYLHTGIKAEKTESCIQDGAIRLRGERRNETCGFTTGRVEVCESSRWVRICDDDWTVEDARVVCRDLGYLSIGVVNLMIEQMGSIIADSSSQVPMCSGSEEQIMDCPFIEADDTTINNCVLIAGIQCYLDESSLTLCGAISTTQPPSIVTDTQPATNSPNTPGPTMLPDTSTTTTTTTTPVIIVIETSEPSQTSQAVTMPTTSEPSQTKSLLQIYHYVIIAFSGVILILIVLISVCLIVFCVRNAREFKAVPNDVSPGTRNSEGSKEDPVNKYPPNTEHIKVPENAIHTVQDNRKSCNLDKNPAYEFTTITTYPVRNKVIEIHEKKTPIAFPTQDSAVISQLYHGLPSQAENKTTSKVPDDSVHAYDDVIVPRIIQTEV